MEKIFVERTDRYGYNRIMSNTSIDFTNINGEIQDITPNPLSKYKSYLVEHKVIDQISKDYKIFNNIGSFLTE